MFGGGGASVNVAKSPYRRALPYPDYWFATWAGPFVQPHADSLDAWVVGEKKCVLSAHYCQWFTSIWVITSVKMGNFSGDG